MILKFNVANHGKKSSYAICKQKRSRSTDVSMQSDLDIICSSTYNTVSTDLHPFQHFLSHIDMIKGWLWKVLCIEVPYIHERNSTISEPMTSCFEVRSSNHLVPWDRSANHLATLMLLILYYLLGDGWSGLSFCFCWCRSACRLVGTLPDA